MTTQTRDFLVPHLMTLPPHRVMIRMIEARLFAETAPDLPEPILDVGSGDGTFAEIAFPGKIIYGIDPIISDTYEAHGRNVYQGLSELTAKIYPFPMNYLQPHSVTVYSSTYYPYGKRYQKHSARSSQVPHLWRQW